MKKLLLLLQILFIAGQAMAQCSGSLGTAIVNETFGAGTSVIGPALPTGVTNLQYLNNTSCPNDGQYTIANYTSGCWSNAWLTLTDHTGDKNGYFMIINASYAPSDFYVKTISNLCAGTTYYFSAWAINLAATTGQILPNITFTVESTSGAILGTYNSGNIPVSNPGKWHQYGFYFKTSTGVSDVVIRMHNNANGGIGNDLAIDDISFVASGPPVSVFVNGSVTNSLTATCNNITLSSTVGSCYVNNAYQWQISADGNSWTDIAGATGSSMAKSFLTVGNFFYRLSVAENGNIENINCRAYSSAVKVNYAPIAVKTFTMQAAICQGGVYKLPSGKIASVSGTYIDTLRTAQGCDSVINTVNLTVKSNTSSTVTATIPIGSNYSGHTVSGVYVDKFTAANGCDSIRTLNLTVKSVSTLVTAGICEGQNYYGHVATGIYTDTLVTKGGYDSIRTVNLVVNNLPQPNLGADQSICIGDTVTLNPGVFSSYLWQDNSTSPVFKTALEGTYWVMVTNANGCSATDTIVIKRMGCGLPSIINTFTPNGDGINDTWNIADLQNYPACSVKIYTRWGQLIFNSIGYPKPWDGRYNGKNLATGVYYYVIDLKTGRQPLLKGYITLLR